MGRALRERRSEVGVGAPELVDPLLGECPDQGATDLLGLLVDRDLAEALPVPLDRDPAEPEVADALLADDVQDGLETAGSHLAHDPLGLLQYVRAVGAGQAAIRREREDTDPARLRPVGEQVVLDRRAVGGEVLHRFGQLLRVRTGLLDALLRPHDARGRDQLHRSRDLLGRLDGADPPTDDAELGAHRYAGTSSPVAPSSTDDIRSQPTSGFTSSGGVPSPRPASEPGPASVGRNTSANAPRASFRVASCSSDRSPVDGSPRRSRGAARRGTRRTPMRIASHRTAGMRP